MNKRIPKIIHYCWFGRREKPKQILNYISSWEKILPDYQIIEWNEDNFPIDYCQYTIDAYKSKKYAFVSDVARLKALYEYGGIYLDTDVELKRTFTPYLDASMILAFESEKLLMTGFFAAQKEHPIIHKLLTDYMERSFLNDDGSMNMVANTVYMTEEMLKRGMIPEQKYQVLAGNINIYTHEVFGAYDADNSSFDISSDTVLIHRCMSSWQNSIHYKLARKIRIMLSCGLGKENYKKLRVWIKKLGKD